MARRKWRNLTGGSPPPRGGYDPSIARGRLGRVFLQTIASEFRQHGGRAIGRLRKQRPQDFLKLVGLLLPKEYRFKEVELLKTIEDEELAEIIAALREVIAIRQQEEREAAAEGVGEVG